MYFEQHPDALVTINGQTYLIDDISARVSYDPDQDFNHTNLSFTHIVDEERPDILSHRLYGTSEYYWTFFIVNNMPASEWPMSTIEFTRWVGERYSTTEQALTHHYEDSDGVRIPSVGWWHFTDTDGAVIQYHYGRGEQFEHPEPPCVISGSSGTAISTYNHHLAINDAKRVIKYIRPEFIGEFVADFKARLQAMA